MSLVLQSSGGGQITIQEPNTASNFTQDLPAVDGTILTSASQSIPSAALPVGSVLQVVRSHVTGKASTTSTSLTKLATSASITPTVSSSKILIIINTGIGNDGGNSNANFSIVRTIGGSDTTVFADVANKYGTPSYSSDAFSWSDLDSPATTSAVTYSLSGKREDGSATPFCGGRATDSAYPMGVMFILMEIAG
jgi:hypothetical protein